MKDKPGFNQIAFYVDMTLCTGCKTCMIACKDKNDLDVGVNWRRVVEYTGGEWLKEGNAWRQDIFSCYFSISCNHCNAPICVESCPTTALRKDENGIVSLDRDKCIGCRYCEWGCPYGAPQYDEKNKLMTKCDFCSDYLEEGRDPACIAACPTRALDFGEFEELQEKLNSRVSLAPLPKYELTDPAIIIKPHRNAKPVDFKGGKISNPEEVGWNPKIGLW